MGMIIELNRHREKFDMSILVPIRFDHRFYEEFLFGEERRLISSSVPRVLFGKCPLTEVTLRSPLTTFHRT